MLTNDKRRHKHLHVTPRRKNKLPSLQMIPATYQEGDVDEKELSDSDITKKLKAEHTSADNEDDRTGTSDCYNDSDCVPREISIILSPSSSYTRPHQKQHQDQTTEPCDDDSWFAASDVPHLIGVSFESDDDDEDNEKDYKDMH